MNTKKFLVVTGIMLGMIFKCMAQTIPSYVPTNGLVGWWPFNGNANDESGNGNNGTVNGIIPPSNFDDRFGNTNSAFEFTGIDATLSSDGSHVLLPNNLINNLQEITVSIWVNQTTLFTSCSPSGWGSCSIASFIHLGNGIQSIGISRSFGSIGYNLLGETISFIDNDSLRYSWTHFLLSYDGQNIRAYANGNLVGISTYNANFNITNNFNAIARSMWNTSATETRFNGIIDDIGIWNRALTQQEITALYNAVNCASNTSIAPQTNYLTTSSTATFTATTSDPNPSYVWQSDFGQGFQTLNNVGNYSGVSTSTLSIANIQVSNHNQAIRVITSSGNCIDTSNTATIQVGDTCIQTAFDTLTTNITVYDTVVTNVMIYDTVTTYTTVTDTLLINTTITGLTPPNNANTIKVFPNPTNDHITIDYGNFALMNGYQLRIQNSLGQQVFQTNITQQSDYLSLNNWGGNGLYFVHLIDPQGNTIDIRKIVLQ